MNEEEEELQSKRPKIVDKRISAGGHNPTVPRPAHAGSPDQPPHRTQSAGAADPSTPADTPASDTSAQGEVITEADSKGVGGRSDASPGAGPEGQPVWTPEQEEQARRMVEEIARTPSLDWVLNSAVNLANVAGTKIEMGAVADAQLAIDALAALISGLGSKLQDAEAPLKQTLAQLQLLYAERARDVPPPPAAQ